MPDSISATRVYQLALKVREDLAAAAALVWPTDDEMIAEHVEAGLLRADDLLAYIREAGCE